MTEIGVYRVGPEIGKGLFATVYKCHNTRTHEPAAVKSVVRSKLKSKKLVENLEIEISILKLIKHPHIVGLLDYNQTPTHFHLVMDYCSMGDLLYFIKRRDQLVKTHPVISQLLQRYPPPPGLHGLNEVLVVHFLQQLASALQFLRNKSLVHRDIKPQNLLLCPPQLRQGFEDGGFVGMWELPILKIADFGFARFLPSTLMAETLCGLPLYMAPEILRYEKYNAQADLWSVGAVLYEMAVGKPPFRAVNHIELLKNIERTQDRVKFPALAQVLAPLKAMIRLLLKVAPSERVSFGEFFSDPLVTTPLLGKDTPLDTLEMDLDLFISEYISPIRPQDRARYEVHELETARDEEIKLIIHKSSPDPSATRFAKNDIVWEKDYVVVEKRAVEVNTIADEVAVGVPERHDRRVSIAISPTNALGKAISLALHRLFGAPPREAAPVAALLSTQAPQAAAAHEDTPDLRVLAQLELLTTKAHAVNLFADVKFSQLIPSPPLEGSFHHDLLPPKMVMCLCQEGVVLYVKTLLLLARGMALASAWWHAQGADTEHDRAVLLRINELVQWIRDKFNECLEKAEFVKLRLQDASSSALAGDVVAEKLIFDRALEISRNAAVNELVKEDLKGCELAYSTAIWMLEAVLDLDADDKLDAADRAMVEKFVISIGNRLLVLKRKLDEPGALAPESAQHPAQV